MKWLYLVVCILTSTIKQSQLSGIKWLLNTRPAVIGTDIKLLCVVNNNSNAYPVIWERGNNLIAIDESLADDPNKFSISKDHAGHFLIIRQLSYNDLNLIYLCSCGVKYDKHVLALNSDIEKHPTANSTITDIKDNDNGNFKVNVTFLEVYPMPLCNISINGNDWSAGLRYNSSQNTWFKVSVLFLQQMFDNHYEKQSILLECRFGGHVHRINHETSINRSKKNKTSSTKENDHEMFKNNFATESTEQQMIPFTGTITEKRFVKETLIITGKQRVQVHRKYETFESKTGELYSNMIQRNPFSIAGYNLDRSFCHCSKIEETRVPQYTACNVTSENTKREIYVDDEFSTGIV